MNNIMIDLETMGSGPDAAIIAIGAVPFDIEKQELGEGFYVAVDLQSSVDMGGVIDPQTVLWWMQQSDQARGEFKRPGAPISTGLFQFSSWIGGIGQFNTRRVWGNGASFDNVILAGAYRRQKMTVPWQFWNERCYRTVKAMYPAIKMQRTGTYHNALDDAESQARHLIAMLAAAKE